MILHVFLSILFPFLDLPVKGSKRKQKSETWHNIKESELWDLSQILES